MTVATYAREEYSAALVDEFTPLLEQHWREVAHYIDLPMSPQWNRYALLAQAGVMRVYTARIDGRLVGYSVHIVNPSMHYSVLTASEDILFVLPEHRGTLIGLRLIAFADDELQAEGVVLSMRHVKFREALDYSRMLTTRLHYERIDQILGRRLDRQE